VAAAQDVRRFDPKERYKAGEIISHPVYGRGKIENVLRSNEVIHGQFDKCYVPRNAQTIGDLDIHEEECQHDAEGVEQRVDFCDGGRGGVAGVHRSQPLGGADR